MPAKNGQDKVCKCCGKVFYVPKFRVDKATFCSAKCLNHGQHEKNRNHFDCKLCGKHFVTSSSIKNRIYCSLECRAEATCQRKTQKDRRKQSRELTRAKRGSNNSRNTRKIAFSIYEKKCMNCGYDEYDFCIDVHHIGECTDNSGNNLSVLCVICHRKYHKGIDSSHIEYRINLAQQSAKARHSLKE